MEIRKNVQVFGKTLQQLIDKVESVKSVNKKKNHAELLSNSFGHFDVAS